MRRSKEILESTKDQSVMSRRRLLLLGVGATTAAVGLVGCAPDKAPVVEQSADAGEPDSADSGSASATPDVQKPVEKDKPYNFDPSNSEFYSGLSKKDKAIISDFLENPDRGALFNEDHEDRLHITDLLAGFAGESLDEKHGTDTYGIKNFSASLDDVREDPSLAMNMAQAKLNVAFKLMHTYYFDGEKLAEQGADLNDFSNPQVNEWEMRYQLASAIATGSQFRPLETNGTLDFTNEPDWKLSKSISDTLITMKGKANMLVEASAFIGIAESRSEYKLREDTAGVNGVATELSVDQTNPDSDPTGNSVYTIANIGSTKVDGKEFDTWNVTRVYK